jgi:hypothetical protein
MGHLITKPSFFSKYIEYLYPLYSVVFYYSYNIVGVPKSPKGHIIGKVHLTPLTSFTDLVPFLNEEDKQEVCSVMVGAVFVPYKTANTKENAVNLHSMATVPSYL